MKILKGKKLEPRYLKDGDKDVWALDPLDDYKTYTLMDPGSPTGLVQEGGYRFRSKQSINESWVIIDESHTRPPDGRNTE